MSRGKTVSREAQLAQAGINLIERYALELGMIFRQEQLIDLGIDGHLEIFDPQSGEATNARIAVQSKATSREWNSETDETFTYTVDRRDLDYWLRGNLPVILVVSRPRSGEAYWASIQERFADSSTRQDRKITFHKIRDRFDTSAREALVDLAIPRTSGRHVGPLPRRETLVANLLPVQQFASTIFVAEAWTRKPADVIASLRQDGGQVYGEWILNSGQIISFHDLRGSAWARVCDSAAVEHFPSDEWSKSDDLNRRNDFVDLLNRALRELLWRKGVYFDKELRQYYFGLPYGSGVRMESPNHNFRGRTVVASYQEGKRPFYRHYALEARFHRFASQWYLELTPTYYFTRDGSTRLTRYEGLLKGIKRLERNDAVRRIVEFWGSYLSDNGLFDDVYPFLVFGHLHTVAISGGIDEASWRLSREDDVSVERIDAPLFET